MKNKNKLKKYKELYTENHKHFLTKWKILWVENILMEWKTLLR